MTQQTAVEWLIKIYLQTNKIDSFDIEQAKEMFEQQIIDAYIEASENPALIFDDAEQYYKKTYNKDK